MSDEHFSWSENRYAACGRSSQYTSILAFSDSGNEFPLSLRELSHPFERLLPRELDALGSNDLYLLDLVAFLGHGLLLNQGMSSASAFSISCPTVPEERAIREL